MLKLRCAFWQIYTDVYSKRDAKKAFVVDRVVGEVVVGDLKVGAPHKKTQLTLHADGSLRGAFTAAHLVAKAVTIKADANTRPLKGKGSGYLAADVECDTRALSQYVTGPFHCRVLADPLQGDLSGESHAFCAACQRSPPART